MVTRIGLVVKKLSFPPKSGDEKRGSSSKKSVSHRKMMTRSGFAAKIEQFSPQIGDENRSRRRK
ncbi:hypothetical protein NSQ14_13855 [Caldifermentibacillus hisashii]|uniref:hypothetical protein n=1 Tax=Caldifermentibacillus hisashii TaxID=996558 RepID=UPI0031FBA888